VSFDSILKHEIIEQLFPNQLFLQIQLSSEVQFPFLLQTLESFEYNSKHLVISQLLPNQLFLQIQVSFNIQFPY
jgi:hypothetical protein